MELIVFILLSISFCIVVFVISEIIIDVVKWITIKHRHQKIHHKLTELLDSINYYDIPAEGNKSGKEKTQEILKQSYRQADSITINELEPKDDLFDLIILLRKVEISIRKM